MSILLIEDEYWWHDGTLTKILDDLYSYSPQNGCGLTIDNIETNSKFLLDFLDRNSVSFNKSILTGHKGFTIDLTPLEVGNESRSLTSAFQNVVINPNATGMRAYTMRVATYELEQLAPNRVKASISYVNFLHPEFSLALLVEYTVSRLLAHYPEAKVTYSSAQSITTEKVIVSSELGTNKIEPMTPLMTPSGRRGSYSNQDWRQLFESIQQQGIVDPNYDEIGRTYARSRDYVKKKWNAFRNGEF